MVMAGLSALRSITRSAASSSRAPIAASTSSVGSALPSSSFDTVDSTASEKRYRGVTKNLKWSRKRKRGEKNKVVIDPKLRRAVEGDVVPFITEMGVVLRQYVVLSNKRWKEVSNHIKQKMFDDLIRDFVSKAEPKTNDYWKATHLKSNGECMDDRSKKVMVALEDIELTQSQIGGPPLNPEEQMIQACGACSGYVRELGGGPRPTSCRGAELREVYQRQVDELRDALEHQQQEAEEREQRLRREAEEREHRLRVEAEDREHRLRAEAEE